MRKIIVFFAILLVTHLVFADARAVRDDKCNMQLDYQNPNLAGVTPQCSWQPVQGPFEVSVYIKNIPAEVGEIRVRIDCNVSATLESPVPIFNIPIQGKKNFGRLQFASNFPVIFKYYNEGDHGNVLLYVDQSQQSATISCNGQIVSDSSSSTNE